MIPRQPGCEHLPFSAHPALLMQLGFLVGAATGREFAFRSPFLYMTKGEICRAAAERGLGDDIHEAVSCDSFPLRVSGERQCGRCTSCLLRRQALHGADLGYYDSPASYLADVVSPHGPGARETLRSLNMMLTQVDSLRRALAHADPWRALVREYPQLWEVAVSLQAQGQNCESVQRGLVRLYRRYCEEWELFPWPQRYTHGRAGKRAS
jgi:hypothetical protein